MTKSVAPTLRALVFLLISFGAATVVLLSAHRTTFFLELTLKTSAPGIVRLFYDSSGGDARRDADSSTLNLTEVDTSAAYRFPLPAGHYASFRLDPLNHPGQVMFTRARIVGSDVWGFCDRLIRSIPASHFKAAREVRGLTSQGDVAQMLIAEPGHDSVRSV